MDGVYFFVVKLTTFSDVSISLLFVENFSAMTYKADNRDNWYVVDKSDLLLNYGIRELSVVTTVECLFF